MIDESKFNLALTLRDMIESVSEDAWCTVPAINDQAQQLWSCVWSDSESAVLGSTFVTPATRTRIRSLATESGCWWVWGARGESRMMALPLAYATFGVEQLEPMDTTTAISVLRDLQPALDNEGQRAIDCVAEALDKQASMLARERVLELLRAYAAGSSGEFKSAILGLAETVSGLP